MARVLALDAYFNHYIPRVKLETLVASVNAGLANAEFLADVYRTPTSDLGELERTTVAEWKKRPILSKVFDILGLGVYDLPKEVRTEIQFRKEHTRAPEDWKTPFTELANRYSGKGFEEVKVYIEEAQQAYALEHGC